MKGALVFEEPGGSISIPPATLASIASIAVERAGARVRRRPRRCVSFELNGRSTRVAIGIVAAPDAVLPKLASAVQESVAQALRSMCDLGQVTIDVTVEEIAS
jgi:uncharacterized alkaline shock family protein YloU